MWWDNSEWWKVKGERGKRSGRMSDTGYEKEGTLAKAGKHEGNGEGMKIYFFK